MIVRALAVAAVAVFVSMFANEPSAQTSSRPPPVNPRDYPVGSSTEELRKRYSCVTRMTRMLIHGTQVSYSRPDGAIFLWYPGNSVVLEGRWETRPGLICFMYATNSYNPATKLPGSNWGCMVASTLAQATVEMAHGDVFGLARRGAVPFVLPGVKTTMAELGEYARLLAPDSKPPARADKGCDIPSPGGGALRAAPCARRSGC